MSRIQEVLRARKKFSQIEENRNKTLLIHYSCESFVDNKKGSHKVTSIAVRYLESGQTTSFSIFQCAEEMQIQPETLSQDDIFKKVEKELLKQFFEFCEKHSSYLWVHWNMRDINYGFHALEHRYKALGGSPFRIGDDFKIDLARNLYSRFSKYYANSPKFYDLVRQNEMTDINILNGQEEANCFIKGEFLRLHQSTLRKVAIFDSILAAVNENRLKVKSSFYQQYGLSPKSIGYVIKEHWVFSIFFFLAAVFSLVMSFYYNHTHG